MGQHTNQRSLTGFEGRKESNGSRMISEKKMLWGADERRVEIGERSVENINIFPSGGKGGSGYKKENLSITVEEIDKQQFDDMIF